MYASTITYDSPPSPFPQLTPNWESFKKTGTRSKSGNDSYFYERRMYDYPFTVSRAFHSLFRVLFNFPLRYLYSIGILVKYLALEGIHLPSSVCILKQTYSLETGAHLFSTYACRSGLSPTMSVCRTETLFRGLSGHTHIEGRPVPSPQLEPGVNQADSAWAFPSSLAATRGISVDFFSSA